MSYHANISMVKHLVSEIMPCVWKARPDTRLIVVGKDPPVDIKELDKNPLVTITGTVEDVRPYLWRGTISAVPLLYGAGIQNKILEAMATGTPVVTSSRTLSALQVQPGKDLLVADNSEKFAQSILQLIDDQNINRAVGNSGLAYVRSKHNWNSIATQMSRHLSASSEKVQEYIKIVLTLPAG